MKRILLLLVSGLYLTAAHAQNTGIGLTSNLLSKLHVQDGAASLLLLDNSTTLSSTSTADLAFKNGSYYTGMIRTRGTGTNVSALGFYTFASPVLSTLYERMTILDNGNVGVSQTSPAYTLDVTGTFRTTGAAIIGGSLRISGTTPTAGKVLTATNTSGDATWQNVPGYNTAFKVSNLNIQSITNNTNALVNYDYIPASFYNDGNNFSATGKYYTVPASGVYQITANVFLQLGLATSDGSIGIYMNATTTTGLPTIYYNTIAGELLPSCLVYTVIQKFTAGEQLSIRVANDSGGPITISNSNFNTQITGVRIY